MSAYQIWYDDGWARGSRDGGICFVTGKASSEESFPRMRLSSWSVWGGRPLSRTINEGTDGIFNALRAGCQNAAAARQGAGYGIGALTARWGGVEKREVMA